MLLFLLYDMCSRKSTSKIVVTLNFIISKLIHIHRKSISGFQQIVEPFRWKSWMFLSSRWAVKIVF
jgi:hypothetical protein